MAAFEDFRQLLILYYDANFINDEDFVLLYDMFPSRNPSFPYYEYACFDLNNMSEAECKVEFRFEKKDLPALAEALRIPPSFKLRQGSIVSGMESLCIFLRRLAYPCRFGDKCKKFRTKYFSVLFSRLQNSKILYRLRKFGFNMLLRNKKKCIVVNNILYIYCFTTKNSLNVTASLSLLRLFCLH